MLKLKLQYFDHMMQRANSLEKTLMLGKMEGRRRRGQWRMRQLDGSINTINTSLSKLWETVKDRNAWCAAVQIRHDLVTEQQDSRKLIAISGVISANFYNMLTVQLDNS